MQFLERRSGKARKEVEVVLEAQPVILPGLSQGDNISRAGREITTQVEQS